MPLIKRREKKEVVTDTSKEGSAYKNKYVPTTEGEGELSPSENDPTIK